MNQTNQIKRNRIRMTENDGALSVQKVEHLRKITPPPPPPLPIVSKKLEETEKKLGL